MCTMTGSPTDAVTPRRVLIAEDEALIRMDLAEMLREDGLTVEIARDGAAAIARFTHAPVPDALVTELTTAHADAASVSRFARAQRPGLPVLIVTGYPNLFQADAFGGAPPLLFTKPVDYIKLKDALIGSLPGWHVEESAEIDVPLPSRPALESAPNDAPGFAGDSISGVEAVRAFRRS